MNKIVCTLLVLLIFSSCTKVPKETEIGMTTGSEKAALLFTEALVAMEDVYVGKFIDLTNQALAEDPDFFRANYLLSVFNLYMGNNEKFKEYGQKAADCPAKLSEGEAILKEAITKLLQDPKPDLTDLGHKLVERFPDDFVAYENLLWFQVFKGNNDSIVSTLEKMAEKFPHRASVVNQLGYVHLNSGNFEKSRESFDKYIEMVPHLPNPYDSKGDYYMVTGEFQAAYESFQKANQIDSTFSAGKMLKAKAKIDSLALIK